MTDVFISYKREEREAVQIIADKLVELKLDVWFDAKLRSGGSFDEEIAAAIQAAKAVLTCWTPAALDSEWVRGEATIAREGDRLVACFLQPTTLIPPFNLIHAEDLSAWAGREDDPAWLKVLERIGKQVDRPGLATYQAAMRPGASIQELKAWAGANGADPLVETVWARIATIEGEGTTERLAREKQEARALDERRKAQAVRSRQLARQRGLRDPKRERRRWFAVVAAVVALGIVSAAAFGYTVDAQSRERQLRDDATTPAAVRAFLVANSWHPISGQARAKLLLLDAEEWRQAASAGTIEALQGYVDDASQEPRGQFLEPARSALDRARRIKSAQEQLARLRFYDKPATGGLDEATREAVKRFRFRWMLPVTEDIDDALFERLAEATEVWSHPKPSELVALRLGPPTEDDYLRIAQQLNIDAATLGAVIEVETNSKGMAFGRDGRPIILFEATRFSRLTQHKYDESHPRVSSAKWNRDLYGRTHEDRWQRLEEAFALDPDAALASATYGRFQIMGDNYKTSGFQTVGEFVRFMSESEANQLEAALLGFMHYNDLVDYLQRHDWEGFVRRYNGPSNTGQYVQRLREAYERRLAQRQLPGVAASSAAVAPTATDSQHGDSVSTGQ